MADDVQRSIAAKVAGLKNSTPAARRAVYDGLRAALKEDIRAAAPFMPVQTVIAKRRELENAIIATERMAAKSDPPPPPKAATPPEVMEIVAETPQPPPEVKAEEEQFPPAMAEPAREVGRPSGVPDEIEPIARYVVEIPESTLLPLGPQTGAQPRQAASVRQEDELAETPHEDEEARPVSEPAPREEVEVEPSSFHPIAVYAAAAAAVIGAIAVVFVLFAGGDQPEKQASKNRVIPVPNDMQLAIRPSDIPPAAPAAAELIRSAGFAPAAQNALKEANALLARGDYERAIAAYDDAIRLDPTQPESFGNRAFAHWSRGNAAAAVRDYSAALQIQPGSASLRLNRAVAYNRLGEYERAIDDLNEVIRAEPANFDALSSRCWARALFDHLMEALADCSEALKLKPKEAHALDSRGLVHLKLGRLDRAIADYNAALRIEPKLASSLYGRGLARIGRGDRAGGNEDVAAAKAIAPDIQATFARYGVR